MPSNNYYLFENISQEVKDHLISHSVNWNKVNNSDAITDSGDQPSCSECESLGAVILTHAEAVNKVNHPDWTGENNGG